MEDTQHNYNTGAALKHTTHYPYQIKAPDPICITPPCPPYGILILLLRWLPQLTHG